jgi:hypothetical protein
VSPVELALPVADDWSLLVRSEGPAVDASREGWTAESLRAWVKFAGRAREREPLATSILDEIDRSGAYKFCTYPEGSGHPHRVWDGDTIFLSRMTHSPDDMRIIGRGIAIAHDDEQDVASEADLAEREWLSEHPFLVRGHHCEFIQGQLGDGVSLNDLVEALASDGFQSTQRRSSAGEQNISVPRTWARKADVRLSDVGFRWLTERFEDALAARGAIPELEIDALD